VQWQWQWQWPGVVPGRVGLTLADECGVGGGVGVASGVKLLAAGQDLSFFLLLFMTCSLALRLCW